MKNILVILLFTIVLVSCGSNRNTKSTAIMGSNNLPTPTNGEPFEIKEQSTDPNYGSDKDPIKVGGVQQSNGPLNERRFLNALAGPNGEAISYQRQGSCCSFKTPNSAFGGGMLDVYIITWEGQSKPVKLYLNMYDEGTLKIPVGFTAKKIEENRGA